MPIDFSKNRDKDIEEITNKLFAKLQKQGLVAEEIGEQVGESFADGIEQGFEDAASRIAASSLKISKAFKDLAKKMTNQNIELGGISVDFSDIDINEADFQKKINEVFEKFKIDNAIEFDSAAIEKQFKNMLALHTKYAVKLSKLQDQRPKLTSQASIKANAQAQLAIVDGLKEIQKILDQTSGMSIELPHVYFGDTKELRTSISLIEQMEKGEEKVGKQRDTNVEKIRKENKELRERNKILEEKVGPIGKGELPPARKPRGRKPKVETPAVTGTRDSALQQLKRDAEAAARAFEDAEKKLSAIIESEKNLEWQLTSRGFVDYAEKYLNALDLKERFLSDLPRSLSKKSDHKASLINIEDIIQNLINNDALGAMGEFTTPEDLYQFKDYKFAVETGATNKELNNLLNSLVNGLIRQVDDTMDTYKSWGNIQSRDNPEANSLLAEKRKLAKEHMSAAQAYNDAADMKEAAYKRLNEAESGDDSAIRAAAEKARLEEEARLQEESRRAEEARRAEEERVAKEQEEAEKRALELARQRAEEEARITAEKEKQAVLYDGYDSPAREKPAEMGKWKKAKFFSFGRGKNGPEAIAREGRTDGNYNYFKDEVTKLWHVIDKVTGMGTKTYLTFKEAQEDTYSKEMQAALAEKKYAEMSDVVKLGMRLMREAEAVAGLPSPVATDIAAIEEQKKIAEETAAIEIKADEQSVVAEQTELKLAEAELKVEKEITSEKEKQLAAEEARKARIKRDVDIDALSMMSGDPDLWKDDIQKIVQNYPNLAEELIPERDALKESLKPVDEMASKISSMASIKEIPWDQLGQEAVNAAKRISELYDEGITDSEEYIALQYKILNIFDKKAKSYGGVKGSGAKDVHELRRWMVESIKGETGYDIIMDGHAWDAIFSGAGKTVHDEEGNKRKMRDVAAELINHKNSRGFDGDAWIENDYNRLSSLNKVLRLLESIPPVANDAVQAIDEVTGEQTKLQIEDEKKPKHKFARTINGKSGKFTDKPEVEGYSAMSRDDATGYISDHYDHDVWDKWYSKSLDPFRTQIAQTLENDIKMRNAALNQMWDEYKHLTGQDIGFDEFLHKKIPLYRGEPLDSQSQSEKALSFSLTSQTAEEFGERVLEIWLRPIDTLGMANPTYVHQPEAEVMVSKEFVPEYNEWRKSLITQPSKKTSSEEKYTYDADSGQMSMLPAIEEEIKAKDKLAEANDKVAKSQKKIKEAAQGTQMSIDDIIPANADEATPKAETEAKALNEVGEAADKAANSKKKFAKANKEVATSVTPSVNELENEKEAIEDVGEATEKATWQMTRPGVKSNSLMHTSDELENFNLPLDYMGERGQDAVQIFAKLKSEIEEMTGKPVIVDFISDVNDEGQLEAVGATLKYVNEEAGVTVKQFYDIKRNEDGVLVATQSQEKATLAAAKAAKVFNTEMQQKLALEQIRTLEGQMGSLELDLTEVKNAAQAINDKASLEKFNLALRSAKEQAKQLKTELKGQNTLDTIASMERALLTLPSRLEEVQRRLKALGDIEGIDTIDDVLRSINNEYQRFLNSDDSEEKVKLFRDLTSSMVWANAEIRNLGGKNTENQRQESAAKNANDAQKKADRESYAAWWKSTIDAQDEADKYEKMLLEREQAEKAKDERVIAARKKKEEAYNAWWQKALFDKERAPNLKYGKTTANSARRKLDATEGAVDALGVTNPEVLARLDAYKEKVTEVERLRERFASDHSAAEDDGLVKQFQKAAYEAEQLRRGIKSVVDEEQKLMQMSSEQGFAPIELSVGQMANLQQEMIAYAQATAQGRMEIKGWNADHTKMFYTVTDSKGAVDEMTMALGQGTNRLFQLRTATKETGTLIQQVLKGIKVKAKELLSFVIGGGSVYKVIELLRQGIQYVREIDLALTELKKVTDETEETYDRFLETAAKTGEKLGSTIAAVTEATATFAKLGYSMEQATEMAEAAIVYKNVGDNIASTEDAADSIISTMKGFKLEATEAMRIVDRFNEVGKSIAHVI